MFKNKNKNIDYVIGFSVALVIWFAYLVMRPSASEIAMDAGQTYNEQKKAIARIDDEKSLINIAIKSEDRNVGFAAVEKLKNQKAFVKIAIEGENPEVRAAAVSRVKDTSLLEEVIANTDSDDEFIRLGAVSMIRDVGVLEKIANNPNYKGPVAEYASKRVSQWRTILESTDQSELGLIVMNVERLSVYGSVSYVDKILDSYSYEMREAALDRITDQAVLVDIARNYVMKDGVTGKTEWMLKIPDEFRAKAIGKVTDVAALKKIAKNTNHSETASAEAAQKRLEELNVTTKKKR